LSAFAIPHGNLLVGEIDIFNAQPHTLHEAQTGAIEQARHEARRAMEVG
jgi:hypothetical protein